jgi:hypothetical protein
VRYSELDGEALLYDPAGRSVHRLSPSAAVVWHRFDGRPLGQVADDGGALGPVIELARRLRALGVAEDAPSGNTTNESGNLLPPSSVDADAQSGEEVRWPGRLVEGPAGLSLELDGAEDAPVVELDRATLVPEGGNRPIDEVVMIAADAHADDGAGISTGERRRLTGIDALRAVVEHLPPDWFAPVDALDRVADLVETLPIFDER